MTDNELIQRARDMLPFAYVPYSHYHVGAAILGADGEVYTGCNFENASYPAGICAERCALGNAISHGCRQFVKIAVISSGEDICTPCGVCRQALYEFGDELEVLCCRNDGEYESYKITELLYKGFR